MNQTCDPAQKSDSPHCSVDRHLLHTVPQFPQAHVHNNHPRPAERDNETKTCTLLNPPSFYTFPSNFPASVRTINILVKYRYSNKTYSMTPIQTFVYHTSLTQAQGYLVSVCKCKLHTNSAHLRSVQQRDASVCALSAVCVCRKKVHSGCTDG